MKEMRTPEEIEKAKEAGKEEEVGPDGHPEGKLYCQRAQSKAERAAEMKGRFVGAGGKDDTASVGVNLYVKNLDDSTDEASLKELFEPFGAITSVAAPVDEKGKCKG